jgi:hypothetical protein
MRRLRGVLISLFPRPTAGGFLLVHARIHAPALPLLATVIVVAIAAVFFREPKTARKQSVLALGSHIHTTSVQTIEARSA